MTSTRSRRIPARAMGDHIQVVTHNGQTIKDRGGSIEYDGALDEQGAKAVIDMATARGWDPVRLRGTSHDTQLLAIAATRANIKVSNPELSKVVSAERQRLDNLAEMQTAADPQRPQRVSDIVAQDQPWEQTASQLGTEAKQETTEQRISQDRPAVPEQLPPVEQLAMRFGCPFDMSLVQDITATTTTAKAVECEFKEGATLHHAHGDATTYHGVLTQQRAELMAKMFAADGNTRVQLTGSWTTKEVMARACVAEGLHVQNVEMRKFVLQVEKELAQQRQRVLSSARAHRGPL